MLTTKILRGISFQSFASSYSTTVEGLDKIRARRYYLLKTLMTSSN
ncbi:hypothetical protein Mgra_00002708 [Meloidogyne graminicola]|uniref:Uncharacterized protein n=1 Tax=Meloidogyne graminicola TaxID=189291 RepID=A0A8S9ZXR4_9BILA|nr:hypothetical protein Mgra_00002708 [Meloidogyne graminicola]